MNKYAGFFKSFAFASALVAMTATAGVASESERGVTHLTLIQSKPEMHSNAANVSHPRDGDSTTFYGTLSENGKPVGYIALVKVQVRNPSDPGASTMLTKGEVLRMATITYELGGNNTIVASGVTVDALDGMVPRMPEVRAIVGGTGKYEFATGQVITTREPDGTYRHELEFRIAKP
ncbi:MAG: hypothetical protein KGN02_01230 [bacterium]|nr:hypothetical protein [bacterium]